MRYLVPPSVACLLLLLIVACVRAEGVPRFIDDAEEKQYWQDLYAGKPGRYYADDMHLFGRDKVQEQTPDRATLAKWKAAYDREEARKLRRQRRHHKPADYRPEHENEGKTYEQWYKENAPIIPSG